MTKKVIIAVGIWAVGKSRFADKWIKKHPEYVLIDTHMDLPKLFKEIKSHNYCIMDYYFHLDPYANKMRKALNCEIEIIVLFDKPESISYRQIFFKPEQASSNVDCYASDGVYNPKLNNLVELNPSKFLDGDYNEYNFEEFKEKWKEYWKPYSKEEVEKFVKEMKEKKGYDYDYQSINLPHGIRIGREGYSLNEQEWEIIKKLVDWKNKRVLDCCGFHGVFSQYICKEDGIPTCFDISTTVVYSASIFAKMNNTRFKLYVCDIDKEMPPGNYDVALLLNVFHHLKNKDFVLKNLQKYPLVIFSINKEDKLKIKEYFKVIEEKISPKCNGNRLILLTRPKK